MLKKVTVALALTGLVAGFAHAGQKPQTGINGSQHDMNVIVPLNKDAFQRTCVFCHTPHSASATANGPLWNRADSVAVAPTAYGWVAPANQTAFGNINNPQIGPTQLCLTCHDGTIAVDSHGSNNAMAPNPGVKLSGAKQIDLTVTHPVGFVYDDTKRPGELKPKTTGFITAPTSVMVSGSFDTHTRTGVTTSTTKTIDSVLFTGGYMTCATCHDVHNTTNASPDVTGAYNYFLNAKEEGSAICLSCHIK